MNIGPTASDRDLYDIAVAIANLINYSLSDIEFVSSKSYAA
jgi:hypothetical protein